MTTDTKDRPSAAELMALVDAYAETAAVNGIRSQWAQMARGKVELALKQLPAPQAQADARDAALLDFIESHAEGVIRLDAVPNYLYWGKHWEHKTARAAIAAAKGE